MESALLEDDVVEVVDEVVELEEDEIEVEVLTPTVEDVSKGGKESCAGIWVVVAVLLPDVDADGRAGDFKSSDPRNPETPITLTIPATASIVRNLVGMVYTAGNLVSIKSKEELRRKLRTDEQTKRNLSSQPGNRFGH